MNKYICKDSGVLKIYRLASCEYSPWLEQSKAISIMSS